MTASLRVAILTHSTNPRGGVAHALSVAEALTDLGHEAVVHAPDPSGRGTFRPVRCGTVSVPCGSVSGLSVAAMVERRIADYRAFFDDVRHRGYDLYHAQDGIGANALADLAEAGILPGFCRTVHHLDAFADPGLAARQARGVSAAARVICVSTVWQERLAREFGITAERVDNGVDRGVFTSRPSDADAEVRQRFGLGAGPVFLSVGGFEARKNSLGLIDAFAALRTDLPGAQLLVVGGASVLDHAAYETRCQEALARHGLAVGAGGPVVRTGPIAQADMPSVYRLADALAFPSLNEGFGLAVIEAMASGTPVVVSSVRPFIDYLAPEDALWCDPAAPASLTAALRRSLDPACRASLRQRGNAVARRFTWAESARRHEAIYEAFVRGREFAHA